MDLVRDLKNLSIVYISISLNQIIKATVPAGTLLAAYIIDGKLFSKPLVISTFFIVIGAIMTVFNNPEYESFGVLCAIGSAIVNVFQAVLSGMLLHSAHFGILIILLTTSIPAAMSLLPAFLLWEYPLLIGSSSVHHEEGVALLVLFMSVLGFAYNFSHYLLINFTSAHYSMVVGNLKTVFAVIISIILFKTQFYLQNWIGLGFSLLAFSAYNFFRYKELNIVYEDIKNIEFTEQVNKYITTEFVDSSSDEETEMDKLI